MGQPRKHGTETRLIFPTPSLPVHSTAGNRDCRPGRDLAQPFHQPRRCRETQPPRTRQLDSAERRESSIAHRNPRQCAFGAASKTLGFLSSERASNTLRVLPVPNATYECLPKDRSYGKPKRRKLPHTLNPCAGKKHLLPHVQRQITLLKNHLLSIFPVHGDEIYVRMSCIALTEVNFHSAEPFTCDSPDALRTCLLTCFTENEVDDVLKLIDGGETVHRQLTDADARALGFLPNIH